MSEIQCFVMEQVDLWDIYLRCFENGPEKCPGRSYHNGMYLLKRSPAKECATYDPSDETPNFSDRHIQSHPDWPIKCDHCDFQFTSKVTKQYHPKRVYMRVDTGDLMNRDEFPVGALWRHPWMEKYPAYCGTDGQSWHVLTPGGEWGIDSRASNCTLPDDSKHKCWCRHGVAPNFDVNKDGLTCAAGAGSILCGTYHGFLRGGKLVDA